MDFQFPQDAFGVDQFCKAHGFSRALFYKLCKQGKGPRTFKAGRRTLISAEAAQTWRAECEARANAAHRHGGGR